MQITLSYSDYQKLAVQLRAIGADVDDTQFGEKVTVTAAIEASREGEIASLANEICNGKAEVCTVGYEERASKQMI